jgi:hypothetical protein
VPSHRVSAVGTLNLTPKPAGDGGSLRGPAGPVRAASIASAQSVVTGPRAFVAQPSASVATAAAALVVHIPDVGSGRAPSKAADGAWNQPAEAATGNPWDKKGPSQCTPVAPKAGDVTERPGGVKSGRPAGDSDGTDAGERRGGADREAIDDLPCPIDTQPEPGGATAASGEASGVEGAPARGFYNGVAPGLDGPGGDAPDDWDFDPDGPRPGPDEYTPVDPDVDPDDGKGLPKDGSCFGGENNTGSGCDPTDPESAPSQDQGGGQGNGDDDPDHHPPDDSGGNSDKGYPNPDDARGGGGPNGFGSLRGVSISACTFHGVAVNAGSQVGGPGLAALQE